MAACSDPNSFMEKISDTECRLKPNHPYYAQVQGQMGVSGAKWCDFIDYTRKDKQQQILKQATYHQVSF